MRSFLDTNILVYTADSRDPVKQAIASRLVDSALDGMSDCRISTQTLSEFVNVALKKLHLQLELAEEYLDVFAELPVVCPTAGMVKRALKIKRRYGIQFYDAQILAAAVESGCDEVLSEDLSDGQEYDGVIARNPFKESV